MATLIAAAVETREVLRCHSCSLVQFRTLDGMCRRCHKPLEKEEEPVSLPPARLEVRERIMTDEGEGSCNIARNLRDIRNGKHLSQLGLALRMKVPRTYISKLENGKAIPTLSSLKRLAVALEVPVMALLASTTLARLSYEEKLLSDPFLMDLHSGGADVLMPGERSQVLMYAKDFSLNRPRPCA